MINLSNKISSAPTALNDILQLATRIQLKQQRWQPRSMDPLVPLIAVKKTGFRIERLQQYFTANDTKDDEGSAAKKHAILLSVCGAETFRLIKSLLAPVKPETKSFQEIVELVEQHHNPEPSATVQRYKFHCRCRQPGETVSQYVAGLRRIAEHCKFGDYLESVLCDRLVCGI